MSEPTHDDVAFMAERGVDAISDALQAWHEGHCDTLREGGCWCCCMNCTEHDVTTALRRLYWELVTEFNARRETARVHATRTDPT